MVIVVISILIQIVEILIHCALKDLNIKKKYFN